MWCVLVTVVVVVVRLLVVVVVLMLLVLLLVAVMLVVVVVVATMLLQLLQLLPLLLLTRLRRFDPGYGYHVDNTTGVATGNDPESIYAVMSGKNFNGGCCFGKRRPCRCGAAALLAIWLMLTPAVSLIGAARPAAPAHSLSLAFQTTVTRRPTTTTTAAAPWRPSTSVHTYIYKDACCLLCIP